MNSPNRFAEKTGALIVVALLFMLSAKLEYEFWLAGNKYTNLLSPEHMAWAVAIASNIAKFLVWGRCVAFKANKLTTPPAYLIGAIVLVVHSMLCGVFSVANNFDRAGLAQVQQERRDSAAENYEIMVTQLKDWDTQQRQRIQNDYKLQRELLDAEYKEPIAKWDAEIEKQKKIFKIGSTTEYIGEDYKYAVEQLRLIKVERDGRLEVLTAEFNTKNLTHDAAYQQRLNDLTVAHTASLSNTTSEKLLAENSVSLTDPLFLSFLNVMKDTSAAVVKPAWIILCASVLINIVLELITILMLAILLAPVKVAAQLSPVENTNTMSSQS